MIASVAPGRPLPLPLASAVISFAPTRKPVTSPVNARVEAPVLFSGDLIFAGSIGRTDFPGGSYPEIIRSLARVVLPLPDDTIVLSGHGPATTVGQERRVNPFLAEAVPVSGPRTGL